MPEHDNSQLQYLNNEILKQIHKKSESGLVQPGDIYELIDVIADHFYKDTGYYCPVKDSPVDANYNPQATDAERKRFWNIYMKAFYNGITWQQQSAGEI